MLNSLQHPTQIPRRPAGVLGPVLVANLRDSRIAAGIPRDQVYQPIYWALAAMLVIGFLANLLVRPVHARFHMAAEDATALSVAADAAGDSSARAAASAGGVDAKVVLAWLAVGIPIAWGIYMTLSKALILLK